MVGFAVLINFRLASAQYFFMKNFADIMAFCGVEESWAQQIKCGRKLGTANKVRKDDWQKECRRKGEGESRVDP